MFELLKDTQNLATHHCNCNETKRELERILYLWLISTFHILLLKFFFRLHQNLHKKEAEMFQHLQQVTKIIATQYIFIKMSWKEMFDLLKDTQNLATHHCNCTEAKKKRTWNNYMPLTDFHFPYPPEILSQINLNLKKPCQRVLTKTTLPNLQPTLNKDVGAWSLLGFHGAFTSTSYPKMIKISKNSLLISHKTLSL